MNSIPQQVFKQNIEYGVENGIALVHISREKQLNALNIATYKELGELLEVLEAEETLRVVVLTGKGEKSFVAGADIVEMERLSALEAYDFSRISHQILAKLRTFRTPVIAAINGYALGGGLELALSCDIRLAGKNALLGMPETSLGIMPGSGGTVNLIAAVGYAKACELLFTTAKIGAEEALRIGLVNHVYPVAELEEKAMEMAARIARNAPVGVRKVKESLQNALDSRGYLYEANCFGVVLSTQDAKTGLGAFVNKTKGVTFSGK